MPVFKGTLSKFNFQILQMKKLYKKNCMLQSTEAKHTPKLKALKRMAKFHISYKWKAKLDSKKRLKKAVQTLK